MSELRTPEVENLLSVFAKLNDNDTVFALLEDLFTIREIRETSQRLAVARLLSSGKPYSAIEEATGASATTIARCPGSPRPTTPAPAARSEPTLDASPRPPMMRRARALSSIGRAADF